MREKLSLTEPNAEVWGARLGWAKSTVNLGGVTVHFGIWKWWNVSQETKRKQNGAWSELKLIEHLSLMKFKFRSRKHTNYDKRYFCNKQRACLPAIWYELVLRCRHHIEKFPWYAPCIECLTEDLILEDDKFLEVVLWARFLSSFLLWHSTR